PWRPAPLRARWGSGATPTPPGTPSPCAAARPRPPSRAEPSAPAPGPSCPPGRAPRAAVRSRRGTAAAAPVRGRPSPRGACGGRAARPLRRAARPRDGGALDGGGQRDLAPAAVPVQGGRRVVLVPDQSPGLLEGEPRHGAARPAQGEADRLVGHGQFLLALLLRHVALLRRSRPVRAGRPGPRGVSRSAW